MSDLAGYVSSFLVSLGLASGFLIGGVIFAFLIAYGVSLFFKKYRGIMSEDRRRPFTGRRRLVPLRTNPKK